MWIAAINHLHNGSLCLYYNNELKFYIEEERLSRNKQDGFPYLCIKKLEEYTNHIDHLIICGYSTDHHQSMTYSNSDMSLYISLFKKNNLIDDRTEIKNFYTQHHLTHASLAFYNSGFSKAAVIVVDGGGSEIIVKDENNSFKCYEKETVYLASYPNNFEKHYQTLYSDDISFNVDKVDCNNNLSVGNAFEHVNRLLGFNSLDSGKTMGLSTYGKPNTDVDNYNLYKENTYYNNFNGIPAEDIAFKVQKITEARLEKLVKKVSLFSKNIIITGGYALNCVSNYNIAKKFPDINLYVEPISHDGGTCLGAAQYLYRDITQDKTINKLKNINYGFEYTLNKNLNTINTSYDEVSKLIANKKVVAMYQGRSEAGPRALGNRSILYDPRDPNGKDIVNKIKNREFFRPFAGSIMFEYFKDWFDTYNIEESPFMMYAMDVKEEKVDLIPSILHIDKTCRVQTVKESDNYHYYNLIKSFYKVTNIPILFNTSFNLAGEPLVETVEDALNTFNNSEIDYLYFPEQQKLVAKS